MRGMSPNTSMRVPGSLVSGTWRVPSTISAPPEWMNDRLLRWHIWQKERYSWLNLIFVAKKFCKVSVFRSQSIQKRNGHMKHTDTRLEVGLVMTVVSLNTVDEDSLIGRSSIVLVKFAWRRPLGPLEIPEPDSALQHVQPQNSMIGYVRFMTTLYSNYDFWPHHVKAQKLRKCIFTPFKKDFSQTNNFFRALLWNEHANSNVYFSRVLWKIHWHFVKEATASSPI